MSGAGIVRKWSTGRWGSTTEGTRPKLGGEFRGLLVKNPIPPFPAGPRNQAARKARQRQLQLFLQFQMEQKGGPPVGPK